jgi:multidrug efflux pump subunit AcrB
MEVTGPLEGAFSTVRGVREISSESSMGSGSINISFDKTTDMDAARFEIAALIRQVYPGLPEGVSRPVLTVNRPGENEPALLDLHHQRQCHPVYHRQVRRRCH